MVLFTYNIKSEETKNFIILIQTAKHQRLAKNMLEHAPSLRQAGIAKDGTAKHLIGK